MDQHGCFLKRMVLLDHEPEVKEGQGGEKVNGIRSGPFLDILRLLKMSTDEGFLVCYP